VIGTLLADRYRIGSMLGRGAMGDVYLAEDTRLGRKVAIKLLPVALTEDADRLRRFEREARTVSALNHPNILTLHEIAEVEGRRFIVTEHVEGTTVRDLLGEGKLPYEKLLAIGAQAADALAAAHRAGVVHRDVKPENIMVRPDGYVKLLDFGLAKLTQTDRIDPVPGALTEAGLVVGTVGYMSPEQAAGHAPDHRTDIFSLGCVLYEMATGDRPFGGETWMEVLRRTESEDPPRLREPSGIHAALRPLIEKCLAKDPDERYQHADDLAVDLRRLQQAGRPARPAPVPATSVSRRRSIPSLAVLPFGSGDPGEEYLSDGLTEAIINTLSQFPKVRVLARSTAFRFKGRDRDPLDVGRELGVAAVLTGRVQRRGDSLLVGAELVDVGQGWQLWGEQYQRQSSDILAVQEDIAREVGGRLRPRLTGTEQRRLAKRATRDHAAYEAYLKGRYHLNKRTDEGFEKAITYFNETISRDPASPLGHAGLAEVYAIMGFGLMDPGEAGPRAKAAAQHALDLDSTLAEVHMALGLARVAYDKDWTGAEQSFRRAIRSNSGFAPVRRWYAVFLTALGRHDEAFVEITRALELDPLSLAINSECAVVLYGARRYDDAMTQARKTLELESNFSMPQHVIGLALAGQERYEEAAAALEQAVALGGGHASRASLGYVYSRDGRRADAEAILKELQAQAATEYVPPYVLADLCAGLDRYDEAFEWLEKAFAENSVRLVELYVDPRLDPIRSDPRFSSLLRRINHPAA